MMVDRLSMVLRFSGNQTYPAAMTIPNTGAVAIRITYPPPAPFFALRFFVPGFLSVAFFFGNV